MGIEERLEEAPGYMQLPQARGDELGRRERNAVERVDICLGGEKVCNMPLSDGVRLVLAEQGSTEARTELLFALRGEEALELVR